MKNTTTLLFFCIALLLVSCSGGADKFVGKWHRVGDSAEEKNMILEKKGDKYDLYKEGNADEFLPFTYDKDHDMLTATDGRMVIDLRYDKTTKHLKAGPRTGLGNTIELEKVK